MRERRDRRRSRSPNHASRGSRRGQEGDTYSSSRDYRAREREDRYSSRREEREWDRDRVDPRRRELEAEAFRSSRRDPRAVIDERPRKDGKERERDRDRDRDREREREREHDRDREYDREHDRERRERKRTASPPRKKEPTPDLTDVPSILERKRRLTQWDIKPPGYENVTAEQAKLSGIFFFLFLLLFPLCMCFD